MLGFIYQPPVPIMLYATVFPPVEREKERERERQREMESFEREVWSSERYTAMCLFYSL